MPATLRYPDWRSIAAQPDPLARPGSPELVHLQDHRRRLIPQQDAFLRMAIGGIFTIMVIGALMIARPVALPVTAGLLLGVVLGPVMNRLGARGIPQGLAAVLLLLGLIALFFGITGALAAPFAIWSDQLPAMIEAIRTRASVLFSAYEQLRGFSLSGSSSAEHVTLDTSAPWAAIAATMSSFAGAFLIFLCTTYFYLATHRELKARILRNCLGREARRAAGSFFTAVEERVARYVAVVTGINVIAGCVVGIIAFASGLPGPLFWAAFACAMNFIPFIGPALVALALAAAGLLVFPSLAGALLPVGAFMLVHLIESQFVTPAFVGRTLVVPPLFIFLSLAFWLWLWGPAGAAISAPLLLVVLIALDVRREYRDALAEGS